MKRSTNGQRHPDGKPVPREKLRGRSTVQRALMKRHQNKRTRRESHRQRVDDA